MAGKERGIRPDLAWLGAGRGRGGRDKEKGKSVKEEMGWRRERHTERKKKRKYGFGQMTKKERTCVSTLLLVFQGHRPCARRLGWEGAPLPPPRAPFPSFPSSPRSVDSPRRRALSSPQRFGTRSGSHQPTWTIKPRTNPSVLAGAARRCSTTLVPAAPRPAG